MNIKRELRCSVRPILATTWLESCKKGIQCGRQGIGPGQNDQNIVQVPSISPIVSFFLPYFPVLVFGLVIGPCYPYEATGEGRYPVPMYKIIPESSPVLLMQELHKCRNCQQKINFSYMDQILHLYVLKQIFREETNFFGHFLFEYVRNSIMGNHSHWDRHQFEENSWFSGHLRCKQGTKLDQAKTISKALNCTHP